MTINQCDPLDSSGREKRWHPGYVRLVLQCIANHPGDRYDDSDSGLVRELKTVLPGENWGYTDDRDQLRDPFRETKSMFGFTGTASFDEAEKTVQITDLGRRYLGRQTDFDNLLLEGMKRYEQSEGNPKIFSSILAALSRKGPLTISEILQQEVLE